MLEGLEGVLCLIDDVLVFGKNQQEHDARLKAVLERLQSKKVTLNGDKCEFSKTQLKFLGHLVDQNGIQADPEKTAAIVKMKPPENVTELRRFMGMVNQLGKFSKNLAEISRPLRELLSKRNAWVWGPAQDKAFARIKAELTKPMVLALYDPNAPTKISADASSYGLGAVLLQQSGSVWKPVAYASRAMTDTETHYAQIEKEALATTWACEKFAGYILGIRIQIETDHKPLVPLLGTKHLDDLPPRVLRFRLRLNRFNYSISHVPGKYLYTADTLSRAPIPATSEETDLQDVAESLMEMCVNHLPASNQRLEEYRTAQAADHICSSVINYCRHGWPDKGKVNADIKPYWNARGEFTVHNGLLLHGRQIVVPKVLQKETLTKIHQGRQGVQRCRLRAKQSVWWPSMSQHIDNFVKGCPTCVKDATPNSEPMIQTELPDFPWQRVASDLFMLNGVNYLLVVDYFSRFPEVIKLKTTTSASIIEAFKAIFSRYGVPETLVSDNGPQYTSQEFSEFTKSYNFCHVTSSPHFPQSNGQAERMVKTAKKLLKESDDPYMALLTYRTTPFPWCGHSPAELLMGRKLRANLPLTKEQLSPQWPDLEEFKRQNKAFKSKQKRDYDRRHSVRPLPQIPNGAKAWDTSGDQPVSGRVVAPTKAPRSYIVETPGGRVRRNRRHLNVEPEDTEGDQGEKEPDPPDPSPPRRIVTRSRTGTVVPPPDCFDPIRRKGDVA